MIFNKKIVVVVCWVDLVQKVIIIVWWILLIINVVIYIENFWWDKLVIFGWMRENKLI